MTPSPKTGLISACLMLLLGCSSVPSSTPPAIANTCPALSRCLLSAQQPMTHADLVTALQQTETDWHNCAARVDIIIACQQRAADHAQP